MFRLLTYLILIVLLFAGNGWTFSSSMVKDLNTSGPNQSSDPGSIKVIGDVAYFSADDGIHGSELWITNGTEAGTLLFKDIIPGPSGSYPFNFTPLGSYIYFVIQSSPYPDPGAEIWRTDGTSEGTEFVAGGFRAVGSIVSFNNSLVFAAFNNDSYAQLWRSDGTASGTILLGPQVDPYAPLTPVGNYLYFGGFKESGGHELWRTDGTAEGTAQVADIQKGKLSSYPGYFRTFGNLLLFIADDGIHGRELWSSDATTARTRLVKDIFPGADGSNVEPGKRFRGLLYFAADDGIHGKELWQTNGTPEGTMMVADLRPGKASSSPVVKTAYRDYLYFTATDNDHGQELWRTQGAKGSTTLFKDINPGKPGSDFGDFEAPDLLYFQSGDRLWTSDGTANRTNPIPKAVYFRECYHGCYYYPLYKLGNSVIFTASGKVDYGDLELWISSGTAAATHQIKDIRKGNAGSSPEPLGESGGIVFFKAATSGGPGLWRTDGTPGGTRQIIAGEIGSFAVIDGGLWFSLQNSSGWDVLHADTDFAPRIVAQFANAYSSPSLFTKFQGNVYFWMPSDLWVSNGTAAGTLRVATLVKEGTWFGASRMLPLGDKLFILAGGVGNALWISDGTSSGTRLLRYFPVKHPTQIPGDSMIALGSEVYFVGSSPQGAQQLWKSDGTEAGTVLVKTIGPYWADASEFVLMNNVIYFSAYTKAGTLWRSDGTTNGTYAAANPGDPPSIFEWNGSLYLVAYTHPPAGQPYYALYKSDGTAPGTAELKQISAGFFIPWNGRLFFSGQDQEHGTELWATDGTAQGTVLVQDLWPGPYSSYTHFLLSAPNGLYFSANDGVHGDELWRAVP